MTFRQNLMENMPYKIVALMVTLVLWVTILGRKDSVMSRDVSIEFLLSANHVVANEEYHKVRVKVSGPRMALKKFGEIEKSIVLDLRGKTAGIYTVEIPKAGVLDLPLGVKILSIQPNVIRTRILQQKFEKGE